MSQLLQYYKSFQQARNPPPNLSQPTFEDLTIDDNLSELQRVVRYVKSSIGLQRLVHVKMLAHVAQTVGFSETNEQIIPLLSGLAVDSERAIKQHLTEQLSLLAKLCHSQGGEDGYQALVTHILPITARLLEDEETDVRQGACSTIVDIAKLIRPDDLGQHVLTIILRLAHEDDKEEMRMTACELLNSMAECLGHDLCKQFVIPEVVSLAEDPVFRVRKATALNFHNICKVGGEHELFERLMPAFVRLSKDDMYRVRRACADSLSEISKFVSNDIRVGVLVEIYLRLTQDASKLVKQSILQQSGMFISTLPPKSVNELILSHYCSMASGPTGDMSVDAELKHYCAFSFPAVLQTIGVGRWDEVRDLYKALVQSPTIPVKQTLAASLHEIARILGDGETAQEELVPIFEDLIQDVEQVQMGVIRHLADFLKVLPEPCRVSYLPWLHDILHTEKTNPFNWRLRQSLALQLPDLISLPPPDSVYNTLFPLVMTLLQDPVASVRKESFKGVAKMILLLHDLQEADMLQQQQQQQNKGNSSSSSKANSNGDDGNNNSGESAGDDSTDIDVNSPPSFQQFQTIIQSINSFIRYEAYQLRQLWLELCHRLLRDLPRHIFEKYFIEGLVTLASDPVSNVRVALALVLGGWEPEDITPWETIESAKAKLESNQGKDLMEGGGGNTTSNVGGEARGIDDGGDKEEVKTPVLRESPWKWLMERADIKECVQRLSQDDNDVYLEVSKLQPLFPHLEFRAISCKGLKEAPGGSTPVHIRATDDDDVSEPPKPTKQTQDEDKSVQEKETKTPALNEESNPAP